MSSRSSIGWLHRLVFMSPSSAADVYEEMGHPIDDSASGRDGVRGLMMTRVPTKPVALGLFAVCVIALIVVGVSSFHSGPSREECNRMWPGHYWADGECRVNATWQGRNGP
jgi:hypothetical protein